MDIAHLLAPFLGDAPLPPLEAISKYLDLLLRWNARMNLTAVRDPESIVTRHIGESLFAAVHLFPRPSGAPPLSVPHANLGVPPLSVRPLARQGGESSHLIDLGSGAGFPGIPIKLWIPQLTVTLIESRQRKATFLREVIRTLRLTGISVFPGRAEGYSGPPADVVALRAVERFDEVLPSAARLLAPTGRLALLIGAAQVQRAHALLSAFAWFEAVAIPQSSSRVLIIGVKPE